LYAIVNADPPPLDDRIAREFGPVLARALAKRPDERFDDAAAMVAALRDAGGGRATAHGARAMRDSGTGGAARAPRCSVTRLLAMPLRVIRPDPETDYLAYSLPDAAAASLAALESLVVRPSATAAKFAQHPLDLERIAREADVDVVLSGTLMRAGDRVRVNCQV